mmetsp:Transcript_72599/g.161321  ORF Transcript_72599/g.161321 Transcript_72599/m.161321 type:complete len:247 (-) Transcript_72599:151-891(-)
MYCNYENGSQNVPLPRRGKRVCPQSIPSPHPGFKLGYAWDTFRNTRTPGAHASPFPVSTFSFAPLRFVRTELVVGGGHRLGRYSAREQHVHGSHELCQLGLHTYFSFKNITKLHEQLIDRGGLPKDGGVHIKQQICHSNKHLREWRRRNLASKKRYHRLQCLLITALQRDAQTVSLHQLFHNRHHHLWTAILQSGVEGFMVLEAFERFVKRTESLRGGALHNEVAWLGSVLAPPQEVAVCPRPRSF